MENNTYGGSAQLYGRFSDSQESRFQVSKRSNTCSAVLKLVVLLIFTNSVLKLQNFQMWAVWTCKCVYLLIVRSGNFRCRNVQIIGVQSSRRVDLLMFTNSDFRVRNIDICAVLSSNEVDLEILRNRVLRQ